MPILLALEVLLQLSVAVHVVRTGRHYYWLFIILAFPVLGCVIYFVTEILPELRHSRAGRQMVANVQKAIDPDRDLRRLCEELDTADTPANRKALAEEHVSRGELAEAIRLYQGALTGIHRDDPAILMGLARAHFGNHDPASCTATLDRLKAANPRFESADGHLLYARALEAQGRVPEALDTYHAVAAYYPGGEAKCRYALLLARQGHATEARQLFQDVVRSFERSKRFHHAQQREWYDIARQNLGA
jgi:hypothetical protein